MVRQTERICLGAGNCGWNGELSLDLKRKAPAVGIEETRWSEMKGRAECRTTRNL